MSERTRHAVAFARSAQKLVGGLLLGATLAAGAPAAHAQAPQGRPDFDARHDEIAKVDAATRDARASFQRRAEAQVQVDPAGGGVRWLARDGALLTAPASGGDAATIGLDYVRGHEAVFGVDDADLDALRLAARYTSPDGVTHVTWIQGSRGLPSYDNLLTVNVARDGRIVNVTGSLVHDLQIASATPALTAPDALAVARHDIGVSASAPPSTRAPGSQQRTRFANGDTARLVAFADKDGDRLAWRLTVAGEDPYVYDEVVDASSGDVLARTSLTAFVSSASVYDYHPGAAGASGVAHAVDLAADPQWMNRSTLTVPSKLDGRNAHAYADVGAGDGFSAGEDIAPSGGTDWVFPQTAVGCASGSPSAFTGICTWSGTTASRAGESTNRAQTTTQLFYFVNVFHDWLASAPIGFTNASHNFEIGGVGGDDQVLAEADDSSGFNNANMNTLEDGKSPRMQMFLFSNVVVNSGDDAAVVYHEYTHGLSNRLVNNGLGGGLTARQSRAMGEGWSDFYAMDYLVAQGYVPDTSADGEVRVGEYVTNNVNVGIRRNAIDCSVGSADATHCPGNVAGSGGWDFSDMGSIGDYGTVSGDRYTRFEVHDDGELWAETLWDLRKTLGATVTRGLVTEAMRLSPSKPSLLDERDAILLADQVTGGTRNAQIWTVFAARGMGYSAQSAGAEATRGVAALDLPPASITTSAPPAVSDPAPLGDGDNVAESGETARLRIALRNTQAAPLTHVSATLSTTTPGVSVGQPTVSYPDLAVRAVDTGDIPFAITLPATLPCTTIVALSLAVHADQGDAVLPLTLDLGTRAGTSYAAAGPFVAIPDNPNPGATVSINVPDPGTVSGLRVSVSTDHTWVGDLSARLTAPDGSSIELFERPGGGSFGARIAGFNGVVFDDGAPSRIQELPAWDGVSDALPAISGAYAPNQPLSRLDGHSQQGTWKLRVFDRVTADTGSITAFSVQPILGAATCSTTAPAPASVATSPASAVTSTSATLNGTLDPTTQNTDHEFQWGATSAYGQVAGAGTATGGSGPIQPSAALAGLAPGATFHFRLVARRAGTVVALTPDATFTTAAPAVIPPPPPPPPSPSDPSAATPRYSVSGVPGKLRMTSKGSLTLAFKLSPGSGSGTVSLTSIPKARRKAIALGTKKFKVPSSGRVKVVFKPSRSARKAVRRLRSLKVRVKITIGGQTLTRTVTVTVAKQR